MTNIGRYEILDEVGRGGMGIVYRGYDPKLDRPVAIKVLAAQVSSDRHQVLRFEREARTLARFNHPHVATIYGAGETDDARFYLVLEFVEGGHLGARLRENPPTIEEALRLNRQIARALVAAHQRAVIHRDLKPENVLIDLEGQAKVVDFGLAFEVDSKPREPSSIVSPLEIPTVTVSEVDIDRDRVVGTPGYMSPEQIRGLPVGKASDLFSLGCILFESLSGERLFEGETVQDRLARTLAADPDWSRLPGETPTGVRKLLERLLDKDPGRRLSDASSALSELEAALGTPSEIRARPVEATTVPNNLPVALSSFVGRERELPELREVASSARLVTITGTGGCGKTRLALKLAEESLASAPDGVWFIDLGPIRTGGRVASALLEVLGQVEEPQQTALEIATQALAGRRSLLLLDNCEHLQTEVAQVATTLLERCPQLRLLATSRELLGVEGEQAFVVPPLTLSRSTGSGTELANLEAVRLFEERARAAKPGFRVDEKNVQAIYQICERLDGIPLAIELAAARVRALAPEKIAERLRTNFKLISGGTRRGQQTVRAAFDWSFQLLSPEEKLLFGRMSVFSGGATLEAIEAICSDEEILEEWQVLDLLTALVEKSLVLYDEVEPNTGRYRLLETGREFGREELVKIETVTPSRDQHLRFFRDLAEDRGSRLIGPEQPEVLRELTLEDSNLRVAITHSLETEPEASSATMIIAKVWRFWSILGRFSSCRPFILKAVERYHRRDGLRATALHGAGVMLRYSGEYDRAAELLREALEISDELPDDRLASSALYALATLGFMGPDAGITLEEARTWAHEAKKRSARAGDLMMSANSLNALGWAEQTRGNYEASREYLEECLELRRRLGDRHGVATALGGLGATALGLGDLEAATTYFEESLETLQELGAKTGIGWVLGTLALVGLAQAQTDRATALLRDCLEVSRSIGEKRWEGFALAFLGYVELHHGDFAEATRWLTELTDQGIPVKEPWLLANIWEVFADYAVACSEPLFAQVLLDAADIERTRRGLEPRELDLKRREDIESRVKRAIQALRVSPLRFVAKLKSRDDVNLEIQRFMSKPRPFG